MNGVLRSTPKFQHPRVGWFTRRHPTHAVAEVALTFPTPPSGPLSISAGHHHHPLPTVVKRFIYAANGAGKFRIRTSPGRLSLQLHFCDNRVPLGVVLKNVPRSLPVLVAYNSQIAPEAAVAAAALRGEADSSWAVGFRLMVTRGEYGGKDALFHLSRAAHFGDRRAHLDLANELFLFRDDRARGLRVIRWAGPHYRGDYAFGQLEMVGPEAPECSGLVREMALHGSSREVCLYIREVVRRCGRGDTAAAYEAIGRAERAGLFGEIEFFREALTAKDRPVGAGAPFLRAQIAEKGRTVHRVNLLARVVGDDNLLWEAARKGCLSAQRTLILNHHPDSGEGAVKLLLANQDAAAAGPKALIYATKTGSEAGPEIGCLVAAALLRRDRSCLVLRARRLAADGDVHRAERALRRGRRLICDDAARYFACAAFAAELLGRRCARGFSRAALFSGFSLRIGVSSLPPPRVRALQYTRMMIRDSRAFLWLIGNGGGLMARQQLADSFRGEGGAARGIAARLDRISANCGLNSAQYRYGRCLWDGDGVAKDVATSLRYVSAAADAGVAEAQFMMARQMYSGEFIPPDLPAAARYARMAADAGLADAQFFCGLLLRTGQGVPEDAAGALCLFQAAADVGHAGAKRAVAESLLRRDVVTAADYQKAIRYLREAAQVGDADALRMLAAFAAAR